MITHLVFFKLQDPGPESRAELVAKLEAMRGRIEVLRELSAGVDVVGSERSWDVGLVTRFDDLAGLETYRDHPAHVAVLEYLRGRAKQVASVDFES